MEELKNDPILDFGGTRCGSIYTLSIIGQIEGHQILPETTKTTRYEHVMPLISAIECDKDIGGLLLLVNTVGGDIEAGLAIAELISGMRKPTASLVLGGGHSIGVPLAVCAKHCLIARSASMTLHPVRMNGVVIGTEQTYRYFRRVQNSIVRFIADHSRISPEKLRAYMSATDEIASDAGTVLYGEEAVNCGLMDGVGDLGDALLWLKAEIQRMNTDENHQQNHRRTGCSCHRRRQR